MDRYFVAFLPEPLRDLRGLLSVAGGGPGSVGLPEDAESVGVGKSDVSGKCATPARIKRSANAPGISTGTPLTITICHMILLV